MRQAGQTLEAIATALDRMDVATFRGGKWTTQQVSRVLRRGEGVSQLDLSGCDYAPSLRGNANQLEAERSQRPAQPPTGSKGRPAWSSWFTSSPSSRRRPPSATATVEWRNPPTARSHFSSGRPVSSLRTRGSIKWTMSCLRLGAFAGALSNLDGSSGSHLSLASTYSGLSCSGPAGVQTSRCSRQMSLSAGSGASGR